jgi:serine phosphatase RsbU (regulator of sigma subunit)
VVAIPLWNGSALIGVLKVASRQPHHFGHERRTLSLALAERVTTAIEAYFAADERGAAAALQRSLVPATLPALDGLELAGRYVPGEGGVSGDWYDVFSLPGGRVGLVMGDVAGHGLPASVVMGRLRSALRAYSLEYDDPATVLSHLDAKIVHFEPDAMATVVYAVTRPPFDEIQISSAGHLPPIVLATDGSTYEAEIPISLPLGVDTAQRRTSGTVRMAAGSSLILYTDGLIERRAKSTTRSREVFDSISSAQEELCRNLSTGPADDIASGILDSMLTIEPPIDDVALLVVRRTGWSTD